jgi:ComF family protein
MRATLVDSLLSLFYPASCLICNSPISRHSDRSLCGRCFEAVAALRLEPPWCPSCGLPLGPFADPLANEAKFLCGRCLLEPPPYAGARSFGAYGGALRHVVHALKFRGRQDLACRLAPLVEAAFRRSYRADEFDLIVPVPLHRRRLRRRGYNQAALLAQPLGRSLGLKVVEDAVVRVRATAPQVGLSDAGRRANVRQAFRVGRDAAVVGRRVLLVDDVMTTGATVASAAAALMRSGAVRVSVLTLARAVEGLD